ncbi:MAG: HupE/UreJ family protein [Pseudomonadota bacterium]
MLRHLLLLAALFLPLEMALAHSKSENYVWINVEESVVSGRFEIHYEDLVDKLDIDIDAGGDRLQGAINSQQQVRDYLLAHFSITDATGPMPITFSATTLFEENTDFVQYPYQIERLPVGNQVTVASSIFLQPEMMVGDRLHRSVMVVEYNRAVGNEFGSENVALVFGPDAEPMQLDLSAPPSVLVWTDFLVQGLLHIAIGLDHILFIVLILLPAVLRNQNGTWVAQSDFKGVLWNTLKIVTTFTVAHSVTLSLAALDLISVNITFVEVVIALSIVALAITNIFPVPQMHSLLLIFVFGLFHGLGFASVMGDLQFRMVLIERILVLFNIGVELGQILIAVVLLPVLFLLRNTVIYRPGIVVPVSLVAAAIAVFWTLERTGLVA